MYLRGPYLICMIFGIVCGLLLSSEALALRSSMTGVKFSEVELRIVTLPQYKARLYERAFQALSKAGLTPQRKIDRQLVEEGKASILIITLFPNPIDGWPDHYSYTHGPHTVVEVMSCVLMSILCGCGPGPSGEVAPDRIARALQSPDVQVRLRALDAWVQQGRTGSVDPVMLALNDPDEHVRTWALQLIEQDWLTELVALGSRDKTVSAQRNQSKC